MMKNIIEQTGIYIRKHGMIRAGDTVITGVSGGADSVCLLFILSKLQKKLGFEIKACHVNHGIRGEAADADEAYVKQLCESLRIPCRFFHENVEWIAKKRKQSPEEAGRMVRREAFETMCREDGGTKIATAHHRDDNAETVLLNIARGTGLKGLCGIRPVQGKWIRPLLGLDREQIEIFLTEQGIRWCTDATNEEDAYTRNRIRHNILPVLKSQVNEGVVRHLEELSVQAQEVWEYLEKGIEAAWERCVEIPGQEEREEKSRTLEHVRGTGVDRVCSRCESLHIDGVRLEQEPPAVQKMLVKECLASVRGSEKDIGAVHLQAVMELFGRQCGRKLDLPGNVTAERTYRGVLISRRSETGRAAAQEDEVRLNIPGITSLPDGIRKADCRFVDISEAGKAKEIPQKSYTKWIDYDIIKCNLSVRTRHSGDYLVVDDKGSRQKLKSWFINEKIPQKERDEMLLVADGQHIVWIPGHRMSRACQISNRTEKILEIKITEDKRNVRNDQGTDSGGES